MKEENKFIVNCPNNLGGLQNQWKVFLAGPIQGGPDWQNQKMPDINGVTWLSPRRLKYEENGFNYSQQVSWETDALRMSNIVLFWIPKPSEDIPGRSYAQTTRFELGENLARGKKVIIGTYKEFPGRKYIEYKAGEYSNAIGGKVHDSLEECIEVLVNYIKSTTPTTYFTSDTHFSSDRALTLSKRPFPNTKEMDWTMIERWNNVVNPCDIVWHLGDFGETWPINFLSGTICFLQGNYEREGKSPIPEKADKVSTDDTLLVDEFILSHEPLKGKGNAFNRFSLFGHIHGRQKVKPWGGLDVGVDCNNFTPVSIEEVRFYKNAIEKGYYDEEVFC